MKKNKILSISFSIFIISILIIGIIFTIKNSLEPKYEMVMSNENINDIRIIPLSNNINKEQIILSAVSSAIYAGYDYTDTSKNAENAEYIIIGKVKSIDGSVNFNPEVQDYVMTRTVGKIEVNQVLKGNLDSTEIPFIKMGGIISISEYEKAVPKAKFEKLGFNKLSEDEKNQMYISESLEHDIDIEEGKTYLMYLKYSNTYKRYTIVYYNYGLREVKTNTLEINNGTNNINKLNSIEVKNNITGEYETLDSILPESIFKNYIEQ